MILAKHTQFGSSLLSVGFGLFALTLLSACDEKPTSETDHTPAATGAQASSDHDEEEHDGHDEAEADEHDEDDHKDGEVHADRESHGDEGHGDEELNSEGIALTEAQLNEAGIVVEPLIERQVNAVIRALGELRANAYASAIVSPRVSSMVVERHVQLGDAIEPGMPLVTLFSAEVAEAQADLLLAASEWNRVNNLGRDIVSGSRYTQARVSYQQGRALLSAYGLSDSDISEFLSGRSDRSVGEYTLHAGQLGRIVSDEFQQGELIEPGHKLFDIIDEATIWVEVRVPPNDANSINSGAGAHLNIGDHSYTGAVTQVGRVIDEVTRTIAVRVEVENSDKLLRPGQFAEVEIELATEGPALAVPVDAVLRGPDGDWVVYVQNDGAFSPAEIDLKRTVGGLAVIEGLSPGQFVVTSGAFFVQSEIAKGGFDIHNH